ncbi:PhoX family phosphatase [Aquabacterium lacunae]|uniref:PhoX family phosphatase n=1 Tax=Aquabacterium lacunae TaxID=2528630 RepID=A0A4Q9GYZ2_9BURK|nr:PhoX family phosphatase [Aquabacterium lacunae]TBO30035.1 PhoX family phosphatase [Aquabacterium lacunae]
MKGMSHPTNDLTLAESTAPGIREVLDQVQTHRRQFLKTGLSASALASAGGLTLGGLVSSVQAAPVAPSLGFAGMGFANVPANTRALNASLGGSATAVVDRVTVPAGYTAQLLVAWGDPIMPGGTAFTGTASETAAQQARQFGMHNDGMHFFPFTGASGTLLSDRGVICVNNEYTHEQILFPDGPNLSGGNYTLEKTRKSQNAHGVSVVEVRRINGQWSVVKNSPYGRRITANTFCRVSGPAAGHALLKAKAHTITDTATTPTGGLTDGTYAYGTINNCAHGMTPWGTYLTCEENWNGNFGSTSPVSTSVSTEIGKLNRRYGLSAGGFGYNWHVNDPRFDLNLNPMEPHLFGWVVEIDPFNPRAVPVKRTALGRFKHESAQYVVDANQRIAFYMGDDERNEYIYKFVCAGAYNPTNKAANRDLLDSGVLYVARFDANLTGQWLALEPGTVGVDGVALRDNPNFAGANDAEVKAKILVKTRMAADAVGATMMDRPEWTGARPRIGGFQEIEVYCTLTNNSQRGTNNGSQPYTNPTDGSGASGAARPAIDAANPRANNVHGHIIRWREAGQSVTATTFSWDLFVQAGDVATSKTPNSSNDFKGNIIDSPNGSADYGAPDGLWFDDFGRLWVQTDQVGDGSGDFVNIGSNVMVCCDPNTGETRRFLTSPNRCEVTGVTMTPDGRTLFVGIQHPGEDATAANPTQFSNWPQNQWRVEADGVTPLPAGRPRSGVVVITKDDGGLIGS